MSEIGKLRLVNSADPLSKLIGHIHTLKLSTKITIERDYNSTNPDAPSHRVYVGSDDTSPVEVGAAWAREIKRGPRQGQTFLSVTIDDPSFDSALSFAVFEDDENSWVATWRRRQAA